MNRYQFYVKLVPINTTVFTHENMQTFEKTFNQNCEKKTYVGFGYLNFRFFVLLENEYNSSILVFEIKALFS